jgi:hypothetical protein
LIHRASAGSGTQSRGTAPGRSNWSDSFPQVKDKDEKVSLATGVSFWQQVNLWPQPNWPTVIVAFSMGFVVCCAAAVTYGMLKVNPTGALPWDGIKRPTARRRFWTYVGLHVTVGICGGVLAVAFALMPLLGIIAAGAAPLTALKILSGGMSDWNDGAEGGTPEKQNPKGQQNPEKGKSTGQEGKDDPNS